MTEKQAITEEMGLEKQWYEEARDVTLETLPAFIDRVMNGYDHDYGTVCKAIAACAVATAWACNRQPGACGGITGFQAGAVAWEFMRGWNEGMIGKHGARIIRYEDLLFPQYADNFRPAKIPVHTWESLREEAKEKLEQAKKDGLKTYSAKVIAHWEAIVAGVPPFGLKVGDSNY